jgi:hypothetical protein
VALKVPLSPGTARRAALAETAPVKLAVAEVSATPSPAALKA